MKRDELMSALREAPVGFAVVEGPGMVFTFANRRYLEMASRTAIVGKKWIDVFPELVGTPSHDAVRAAYQGDAVEVREAPASIASHDGAVRTGFYSFRLEPLRTAKGVAIGFTAVAVEVTELVEQRLEADLRRIEAEKLAARLHDSEVRYRAVFEAIDDGFCLLQLLFDDDGAPVDYRHLEANDAFQRQSGLADPVGKTVRELVPGLDASWVRIYGKVATTGEPVRFDNHAPSLGRWFDVFASRVGDPSLGQVAVVFKDVTLRKRIEAEKAQLLVDEQAARHDAEVANRLKDDFVATVSHELRTPLNAVLGWVSLLREGHLTPQKAEHALLVIERNARAQAQLIEDLLEMSRIAEGKMRLDVQLVDMRRVVEAAVETVRPAADAKGVGILLELGPNVTSTGDARRLEQIVWNLVANAVKFTSKGGHVCVGLRHFESAVEIRVTDDGIGIEREFLPYVFERFRQEDGSTARAHGGLGLGMSIAKQLTELHGGTVTVQSEGAGKGAVFTVRLPQHYAFGDAPASSPTGPITTPDRGSLPPSALAGIEVLAVDDDADSLELLRIVLETCGARVTTARSAKDAIQLLRASPPTVLVSDIGMPGEDGFALIGMVRALPPVHGGRAPAIALTAYAGAADRARCLRAGFNSHVPKPVELLHLVAAILSVVPLSHVQRGPAGAQ